MNRSRGIAALAIVTSGFVACSKSPETLCKQLDATESQTSAADHARCVRAYSHVKEVDPEGFDKLAKCVVITDQTKKNDCFTSVWSRPKLVADKAKTSAARDDSQKKTLSELSALQPTKTFDGEVGFSGAKTVAFSIRAPEAFDVRSAKAEPGHPNATWEVGKTYLSDDDGNESIGVLVELSPDPALRSLDAAKAAVYGEKILRSETTSTGFILETGSSSSVKFEMTRAAGGQILKCWSFLDDAVERDAADKLIPWLESMCTSLTIK